jgi:hypothetical protein
VGDVGSGKTLNLVVAAIQSLIRGRDVHSNFPLKSTFKDKFPESASHYHYIDDLFTFLIERDAGTAVETIPEFRDLWLMDEAQAIWNSRNSMSNLQKKMTDFIFVSRKLGLELRMSTQLASSLDKRAKLNIQVWIVASKMIYQDMPYFRYQYYSPEAGDLRETYLGPNTAARYYPYYETTGRSNTEVMPQMTLGGVGENADEVGYVPLNQFNQWKRKDDTRNKEIWGELRDLNKELKRLRPKPAKIDRRIKEHGVIQKSRKKAKRH